LPRMFIGTKESTTYQVESSVSNPHTVSPLGWNVTDFMTLRWRWHGGNADTGGSRTPSHVNQSAATTTISTKQRAGKAMIDVSRVDSSFLNVIQVNPHRPIKAICSIENMWISTQDALFVIHHYIGTYSQWSFRNDPRTQAWAQFHGCQHKCICHDSHS
jgi:hypothetical protein